ncbi:hypothetical protein [Anaerotignum lactatifermentans]|uniref:hypothetical protein n=1 Tax=Anaerotignum lactatifermentans TaxID=160404 RepID=UPI00307A05E1
MKTRRFGKTNAMISEIGLGTWRLGTKWGNLSVRKKPRKFWTRLMTAASHF